MSRRRPKDAQDRPAPSPRQKAAKGNSETDQKTLWPVPVEPVAPLSDVPITYGDNNVVHGAAEQQAPPLLKVVGGINYASTLLALSNIKGLGRVAIARISDALSGELQRIWDMSDADRFDLLSESKVQTPHKFVDVLHRDAVSLVAVGMTQLDELRQRGIHVVEPPNIPTRLKDLPDTPRWLFVQGEIEALSREPAIALVGTRKPTHTGLKATGYIARLIAAYPSITVVSGLAEGIDEEAHKTTLQENLVNIAFLGHGINQIFPAATAWVRETIFDRGGAIVTEYLPNEHYQKAYFVERNRLQAALAHVVIPVEANPKGGTAHTIRFARRLRRQVVGVRWRGANGILDGLAKDGYPIIDIFTNQGSKQLDKLFRDVVEAAGHDAYPLAALEQRAIREINFRDVRQGDIRRLLRALRKAGKET